MQWRSGGTLLYLDRVFLVLPCPHCSFYSAQDASGLSVEDPGAAPASRGCRGLIVEDPGVPWADC